MVTLQFAYLSWSGDVFLLGVGLTCSGPLFIGGIALCVGPSGSIALFPMVTSSPGSAWWASGVAPTLCVSVSLCPASGFTLW